jgi:chemotaxis protein methyltransferase CheR
MTDHECARFLQWCLPELRFRWAGFRRVRKQVCKRLGRRVAELGLDDLDAYRVFLESHDEEWRVLDSMCRVTITRFYRDRAVWDLLCADVLPALARRAVSSGKMEVRCWSAGCGSGEEAYTLRIAWLLGAIPATGVDLPLRVVATDSNPMLFDRARRGIYKPGSLRFLPVEWVETAFEETTEGHRLQDTFTKDIDFVDQDIRENMPDGVFDLVLCRNLVFTYFDESLQKELLERIAGRIAADGTLVIGAHERLPGLAHDFEALKNNQSIWQKQTGNRQ